MRLIAATLLAAAVAGCTVDDARSTATDTITGGPLPPHETVVAPLPPDVVIDVTKLGDDRLVDPSLLRSARSLLTALYSPGTTPDSAVAALQDGEEFREVLTALDGDPVASTLEAVLVDVKDEGPEVCERESVPSPCSSMFFTLESGSGYPLPDQRQTVFRQDGTLVVAASSFCAFLVYTGLSCDAEYRPRPVTAANGAGAPSDVPAAAASS